MWLKMVRGDDVVFSITPAVAVTDDDAIVWTAKASLADDDEDAVLSMATYDDVVAVADGKVEVTISAADTEDMTGPMRLQWDLQANIEGKVATLASGTLDILMDVTQTGTIES